MFDSLIDYSNNLEAYVFIYLFCFNLAVWFFYMIMSSRDTSALTEKNLQVNN